MIRQTVFVIGEGTDSEGKRFAALRCRTSTTEHFVSVVYEGEQYEFNLTLLRMMHQELNKILHEANELGEKEEKRIRKQLKRKKKGRLVG